MGKTVFEFLKKLNTCHTLTYRMNQDYFGLQKQGYLKEINKEVEKLVNNLLQINATLKDTNSLGQQFNNISKLWTTFYDQQARELGQEEEKKQEDKQEEEPVNERDAGEIVDV